MSQRISLEEPDSVMLRAPDVAERHGHPVEQVLTQWLEWMAVTRNTGDFPLTDEYPIYTPYGNEAAAQILQNMLDAKATKTDRKS